MKSILTRVAAIAALSALVAGAAFAAPPKHPMKKHPMKMAMHMKCPFCGMSLSTKKTAKMNTPIMMHGKMYYTCAECKEKIAMHHMAPKGKMMAMHMKCPFCGMYLSSKKTAKMDTPIMMHGKMYYTCAECKEKIAAHHMAPKGKMMGHMKGHMKGKM